jgi:SpoVK/Ycf46/Vps4 family AAA+-type ATPase
MTVCVSVSHWGTATVDAAHAALIEKREPMIENKVDTKDAGAALAALLAQFVKVDPATIKAEVAASLKGAEESILALVEEKLATLRAPREIAVKVGEKPPVVVGVQHKNFPLLIQYLSAGVHVWLAGPAGSGKTSAVEAAAKALGLTFYFNGAIDTEYKLSGFVDAQGRIVSTAFRKAYTEGGVYLFDEVDASLPGATLAFNAALANGHCDFPGADKPVPMHSDFRCVAAGNTWGMGATFEYVGRNKLDAAFLNRFVSLPWEYDPDFERELAVKLGEALGFKGAIAWCNRVQTLRNKARGMKVVISPRATLFGIKLMAAGVNEEQTLEATIGAIIGKDGMEALENR